MDCEEPLKGPLTGIAVIECADGVAASYAGRLFSIMGADVVKVEPPQGGCRLRQDHPSYRNPQSVNTLFEYLGTDKRSVTCDLSQEAGRRLLHELVSRADVLIDDTPVSRRSACGIDPNHLCESFPDLVYTSVLPFGATGPLRDYNAYEINIFHAGGEGHLMPNGLALEMFPDRPPIKIFGHFASIQGGTMAVSGALAALIARPLAGGQFVDISVQDANVALGVFNLQRFGEGVAETRATRSFKYGGVLQCADGYVEVLTIEDHQWRALVEVMGRPDWTQTPEMLDPMQRGQHGEEVNRRLRAWSLAWKVDDLVRMAQAAGVPMAKYNAPGDVLGSAQARSRELFASVQIDDAGTAEMLVAPYQFSGQPLVPRRGAPRLGADNEAVWCGRLGHGAGDLARWRAAGVI